MMESMNISRRGLFRMLKGPTCEMDMIRALWLDGPTFTYTGPAATPIDGLDLFR